MDQREYVVGLPVAVTVHADGRVTLDVDIAEIGDIGEDDGAWERYTGPVITSDIETAQNAAQRVGNCITLTINPTA